MTLNWSQYQTNIFNAIENTDNNLACDAVAGGAKTTTLVNGTQYTNTNDMLFLAFNKHIVNTLSSRMPDVTCKTTHALGRSVLGKVSLDNNKAGEIAKKLLEQHETLGWSYIGVLKKMADFTRLTLTHQEDKEAIFEMLNTYNLTSDIFRIASELRQSGLEVMGNLVNLLPHVVNDSNVLYEQQKKIDFVDMLYLPIAYDKKISKYDFVFIDEAQDLNAAQTELALRSTGGRLMAVGDKFQSVQFFAGSMSSSFNNIVQRSNATVLPLSVCYRCPVSHIEMAQYLVPHIEPAPNAIDGTIHRIAVEDVSHYIDEEDTLIISRTNAPLFTMCYKLIAQGIPASIRGIDMAKGLVMLVKTMFKVYGNTYDNIGSMADAYFNEQTLQMMGVKNADKQLARLQDQINCIKAVIEFNPQVYTLDAFERSISAIFDNNRATVWLSSVHRAKGLEAKVVIVLKYNQIELKFKGLNDEQLQQERNIHYVALTRATDTLVLVEG